MLKEKVRWKVDAACREVPVSVFFPEGEDWKLEAKRVARDYCGTCPVRERCLEHAIVSRIPYGVWGGRIFGSRSYAA